MEITQVHYQKLVNLGDYENERVGAWARVEEDETPSGALDKLKGWVEERAGAATQARSEIDALQEGAYTLRNEVSNLESRLETAKARWERAKAFLTALGLDLPSRYSDDIPF